VIGLPEKKNPSHVAQEETPCPIRACSFGSPNQRADARWRYEGSRSQRLLAQTDGKRPLTQVRADNVPGSILGAKARRLLLHILDQFWPLNPLGKTRKILDQRGQGELSAGLVPFKDERLQVRARGV